MAQQTQQESDTRSTDLRESPMMAHLLDALDKGTDVGHYGRLTFVMIAQWFMDDGEITTLLAKQPDMDEGSAKAMVAEVKGHGYNPPKRDKILAWQQEQDFAICPNPDDPRGCNVYSELKFPDEVYENIGGFWEEKAEAGEGR